MATIDRGEAKGWPIERDKGRIEKERCALCRSGSVGLRVGSLESLTLRGGNNWGARGNYCQVPGAAVALDNSTLVWRFGAADLTRKKKGG